MKCCCWRQRQLIPEKAGNCNGDNMWKSNVVDGNDDISIHLPSMTTATFQLSFATDENNGFCLSILPPTATTAIGWLKFLAIGLFSPVSFSSLPPAAARRWLPSPPCLSAAPLIRISPWFMLFESGICGTNGSNKWDSSY